jgi:excisionase family DNA binding protein
MHFVYQFPLFTAFLRGNMSPLKPENAADSNYKLRLQEQLTASASDEGLHALRFLKPLHPKQEYYRRALLSETFAYCNELRTKLLAETNPDIRAYYREVILDRHLTTCLQQLGEETVARRLTYEKVVNPDVDVSQEESINAWCFQLMKVCLAKAYLEVQDVLADVVVYAMTEKELYSTYLQELKPIITFLQKRDAVPEKAKPTQPYTEKPVVNTMVASPAEALAMDYLTTKEVAAILKSDTRTITRKLESKKLKGVKEGGKWLIEKHWFEQYIQSLNPKTN